MESEILLNHPEASSDGVGTPRTDVLFLHQHWCGAKLRSWQTDDVAEGCGRCRQGFFPHRLIHRFSRSLAAGSHVTRLSQSGVRALGLLEALTHVRTRASLKIPSVIQPGRRWASPAKLTSPIFLHTFSENHGISQVESGSGGLPRHSRLFITRGRRRARPHGETAFAEAECNGEALEIMDVCAQCVTC